MDRRDTGGREGKKAKAGKDGGAPPPGGRELAYVTWLGEMKFSPSTIN